MAVATSSTKGDEKHDPPQYSHPNSTIFDTEHDELPPPYQAPLPDELTDGLQNLELASGKDGLPTAERCIVHLQLLETFHQLREEIEIKQELYKSLPISDPQDSVLQAKIKEKRWQVFVTQAASRFEGWWQNCIPVGQPLRITDLQEDAEFKPESEVLQFSQEHLPPLDCLRNGKMKLYNMGFPWGLVKAAISTTTGRPEYHPSEAAQHNFESRTSLPWNPENGASFKSLSCPSCNNEVQAAWTRGTQYDPNSQELLPGTGYSDNAFAETCNCGKRVTHDALRVRRFQDDVERLQTHDTPLPGTFLDTYEGRPTSKCLLPSLFVKVGLGWTIKETIQELRRKNIPITMDNGIKRDFEKAINQKAWVTKARPLSRLKNAKDTLTTADDRWAIRRMMSRYWFNSSPFALNLTEAVVRQGSFIKKMHNIDWLHAPHLSSIMERTVLRYERFFSLMKRNPKEMFVPTLDIDLAWHTHQLSSRDYYDYSVAQTDSLIDHDDKVEENDLSNAFGGTSKKYQQLYSEPYSECLCWYCCALRDDQSSSTFSLFKKSKPSAIDTALAAANAPTDPYKGPHISNHNAVRTTSSPIKSAVHIAHLAKTHKNLVSRSKKKGRAESGSSGAQTEQLFVPFAVDPGLNGGTGVYVGSPTFVDLHPFAYGNCAAGTCGGMAAAGGAGGYGAGKGGAHGELGEGYLNAAYGHGDDLAEQVYRMTRANV